MSICSYLVIPAAGRAAQVAQALRALPGCEVVPAQNRDVLALVTETADTREEQQLRSAIEEIPGIYALVLTFGDFQPQDGDS